MRRPPSCRRASCCHAKVAPGPMPEVALRAAETPDDAAGLARDLVDGPGVARRDEQVAVGRDVDRVDVEVVERLLHGAARLGDVDVVEAAPLEEHTPARQLQLLHDASDHGRVAPSADRGEAHRPLLPARDQRRTLGRQQELVLVLAAVVAGAEARELTVGRIRDHVLTRAVAPGGRALPPRQHGLAAVALDAEAEGGQRRGGLEPDDLAGVVEDQRPALARARVRRDEQQSGRGARRCGAHDVEDRRPQVEAAVEEVDGLAEPVAGCRRSPTGQRPGHDERRRAARRPSQQFATV